MNKTLLTASVMLALVSSAGAATIGVFGFNNTGGITNGLNSAGFVATDFGNGALSSANFSGLGVVILARTGYGQTFGSPDLTAFIASGGKLITEWSDASYAMSLLGGAASDNYSSYFTNDSINFTAAGLGAGLGNLLGGSYTDGGSTDFFRTSSTWAAVRRWPPAGPTAPPRSSAAVMVKATFLPTATTGQTAASPAPPPSVWWPMKSTSTVVPRLCPSRVLSPWSVWRWPAWRCPAARAQPNQVPQAY